MTHQGQNKVCTHNYQQFTRYTPYKVRKTTIDRMSRKDKQSPQMKKKEASTNDPGESSPRREATQNKIRVISKE